jgi:hypothetical protein
MRTFHNLLVRLVKSKLLLMFTYTHEHTLLQVQVVFILLPLEEMPQVCGMLYRYEYLQAQI